jgi:2-polyprenyl-3-methyl-5-hydroxy-6-metoxy-1,4-benzoquinol methylase
MRSSVVASDPPQRAVTGFARWVARECPPGARVLNIGAGRNLSGPLLHIREKAGHLVGVDPDASILDNVDVDERHHSSLEAYAATAPEPFDLAFSVFVLEHVADPRAFAEACATVLRPGGVLMAVTVNKWHYFGLSTWAATRLHVADLLLPRLRPEASAYHFPTEYRLNTAAAITRHLDAAGFDSVDFRYWDLPVMYEPYLPRPIRGFATHYQRAVYRLGRPQLMGHLTFKATL